MKANTNRRICLLLVCIILIGNLPVTALADTGRYTISLPEDIHVEPGNSVSVPVEVGHTSEATSYNAFDVSITYDPSVLKLTTKHISGMSVVAKNGIVQVLRYGNDLPVGTTSFSLTFEAVSTGETKIRVRKAKVGIQETAYCQDASDAVVLNDMTVAIHSDCLVNFDSMGGSMVPSQKVSYGNRIRRPSDPTRDGYSFAGWFTDKNGRDHWDFESDTVSGNMTLYAKWYSDAESPPTGDSGNLVVWTATAAISLLLLLVIFLFRKKWPFSPFC